MATFKYWCVKEFWVRKTCTHAPWLELLHCATSQDIGKRSMLWITSLSVNKTLLQAKWFIVPCAMILMVSPSRFQFHTCSFENIIHYDISACNILLSSDLDLKICNFGSAALLGEESHGLVEFWYSLDQYHWEATFQYNLFCIGRVFSI